jgi:non-ribosomal peptide synthetase component F
MVTHRHVVSLPAAAPLFTFGATDVWTLFHSYAFDSVGVGRAAGGGRVVVPQAVSRSSEGSTTCWCASMSQCFSQMPSAFRQ